MRRYLRNVFFLSFAMAIGDMITGILVLSPDIIRLFGKKAVPFNETGIELDTKLLGCYGHEKTTRQVATKVETTYFRSYS